jgi:hypothetical protein
VSFSSFVISLAQSAMMHLGEVPDPATGQPAVDLPLARNTIDLIGLLKQKTEGNLDAEEQRLVETVLYELRTRWLAQKGGAPG